jgi:hypothetical protein
MEDCDGAEEGGVAAAGSRTDSTASHAKAQAQDAGLPRPARLLNTRSALIRRIDIEC